MRKKLIKKLNILNRNTYINFYSNYNIYTYLNNHNLKLFFYFLNKKKYYFKNANTLKSNVSNNVKLNYFVFNTNLNYSLNDMYISNYKDKFFNNEIRKKKITHLNNKLNLENSNVFNKNTLYINKDKLLLNTNNINLSANINVFYKELFVLIFLINIVKIFELYKVMLNLIYITNVYKA